MEVAEKHRTARKEPRALFSALAIPALLFVLVAGFFWKLTLTNQYSWLESPDLANQVLPWFQFQAGEWHAGRFPLWDPYLWGGQPLVGQAQPGAVYPPNWLLFALPLRSGWIRQSYLHWYYVLIHFAAALFMYWLCRDLKRSREASAIAGLVFALAGFVGTTDWPQMLNGAIWAPLVFLYLLRVVDGRRRLASAALSGMFLGVSWLSGHHQIPIYVTVSAAAVWLWAVWRSPRLIRYGFVFAAFLFLTSALQTLPAWEYGRLALRWVGPETPIGWNEPVPYVIHRQFSSPPLSLLGILFKDLWRHSIPFLGVVATALGLAGLYSWRERTVRLFAILAAAGLLFSLGSHNVFHGLLYSVVPLLEKARSPSMANFIFHLGFCSLIAYGIDSCIYGGQSRSLLKPLLWLSVGLGALVLAVTQLRSSEGEAGLVLTALLAALLAAVLAVRSRDSAGPRTAASLIALLALIEIGTVTGSVLISRHDANAPGFTKALAGHADLVRFLRTLERPFRVEAGSLPFNFNDWHGIAGWSGYLASVTENLLRIPAADRLFGVGYRVAKQPLEPWTKEVFSAPDGWKVYADPGVRQRTWVTPRVEKVSSRGDIAARMQSSGFDPQAAALTTEDVPALQACAAPVGSSGITAAVSDRVEVEARSACRSMLVLADTWYPGWTATVDGKRARVWEVYGALRGVILEPGAHTVVFRYRPWSVMAGALLTALGLAGACLLAWRQGRAG